MPKFKVNDLVCESDSLYIWIDKIDGVYNSGYNKRRIARYNRINKELITYNSKYVLFMPIEIVDYYCVPIFKTGLLIKKELDIDMLRLLYA